MFCSKSLRCAAIAIRIISVSGEKGQRSTLGRNRVFWGRTKLRQSDKHYVPNCWIEGLLVSSNDGGRLSKVSKALHE
jgi:hypothetical protein